MRKTLNIKSHRGFFFNVTNHISELVLKIGVLERQIKVLAERLGRLPADMDLPPIADQMKELQAEKVGFVEKSKEANK